MDVGVLDLLPPSESPPPWKEDLIFGSIGVRHSIRKARMGLLQSLTPRLQLFAQRRKSFNGEIRRLDKIKQTRFAPLP
jgi:hypothetical protein